ELFDAGGAPVQRLSALSPQGRRRMSANPHTNGGELLRALELPDFRQHAVEVPQHGKSLSEATRVLGEFLLDVMRANTDNFRLIGPDEVASNRLDPVFQTTSRAWMGNIEPNDDRVSPDGR